MNSVCLPKRIEDKILRLPNGCWEWTGCKTNGRYGRVAVADRKQALAHRYVYELSVGKIPEGLTLDHLCNNPPCVNPEHLEPVTLRVNLLRGRTGLNLLKTHCPQGHPYDEENTYLLRGKWRRCRTCVRKAGLRWYYNKKLLEDIK